MERNIVYTLNDLQTIQDVLLNAKSLAALRQAIMSSGTTDGIILSEAETDEVIHATSRVLRDLINVCMDVHRSDIR